MWVSDKQILKAVRTGLARLNTELAGTASAHLLGAINIAVGELAARADNRYESLLQSCADARRIADQGVALAARAGDETLAARLAALPKPAPSGLVDTDAAYNVIRQLLVDCILLLNKSSGAGETDAVWRTDVTAFFFAVAQHEKIRATQNAAVPALEAADKESALDMDSLGKFFARWQGTDQYTGPFELSETKLLSGGFSRQTILIKVRDGKGREIPLVIRKQVPDGFLDGACNALAEETPFFKLCHAHGLPVPQLLWHETDKSIIGGEFFVTECMPGTTIGSSYQMAEGIGEDFFRRLARTLAELHSIDWMPCATELRASSQIAASDPVNADTTALAMVAQFESYWRAANLDPLPTFEIMVEWLKHKLPQTDRKAVLCHGDIGFHNLLVKDGQVTALLDWETSRLGDPARDISYIRTMVSHYVKWEDFLGWYREAGGPVIDQASIDYYNVFCAFAHVIVCEVAMGDTFPRSDNPDLGYLHLGLPIKAYFFDELLRDGAPIWGR